MMGRAAARRAAELSYCRERPMSAFPPKSAYVRTLVDVSEMPCVDGSVLARAFFTFAAWVGAAMCSAFRCGSHDRKMALKIHCFSALARALSPADPHSSRPGKLKEAFRGHGWGRAKQGSVG